MYRKLYIESALLFLVPIILYYLFPNLPRATSTGIGGAIGAIANYYYVQRSIKKVRRLAKESQGDELLKEKLEREGGVSRLGALFGLLLFVAIIVLALFPHRKEIPGCSEAHIIQTAESVVRENVAARSAESGLTPEKYSLSDFREEDLLSADKKICSFALSYDGIQLNGRIHYEIFWQAQDRAYYVRTISNSERSQQ